jgi:hypothetical protein
MQPPRDVWDGRVTLFIQDYEITAKGAKAAMVRKII